MHGLNPTDARDSTCRAQGTSLVERSAPIWSCGQAQRCEAVAARFVEHIQESLGAKGDDEQAAHPESESTCRLRRAVPGPAAYGAVTRPAGPAAVQVRALA